MGRTLTSVVATALLVALTAAGCAPAGNCPADADALFVAIEEGDAAAVRAGIDRHKEWIDVEGGPWGVRPIQMAAWCQHPEIVTLLLDRGADANDTNGWGWTPMHQAAETGNLEVARLLVARGAKLDTENREGITPLGMAVINGHQKMVAYLLDGGVALHGTSGGSPLLTVAALNDRAGVAKTLVDRGAEVNRRDDEGRTALHWATGRDMADLLIARGAEVDATGKLGRTPLHVAAFFGYADVAALLVDKGARLEARDHRGETPLHVAASEDRAEVVKLLLARGADAAARNTAGQTAGDLAAAAGFTATADALAMGPAE